MDSILVQKFLSPSFRKERNIKKKKLLLKEIGGEVVSDEGYLRTTSGYNRSTQNITFQNMCTFTHTDTYILINKYSCL